MTLASACAFAILIGSEYALSKMRFAVLLLVVPLIGNSLPAQPGAYPEPSRLIENAVEHEWADENQVNQFTYLELWNNRNFAEHGELVVDETAKFESIALSGKAYLRMIEQNGKPLPADDANAENRSYDSAIAAGKGVSMQERISAITSRNVGLHLHLGLLPKYFHSIVVGSEILNGRPNVYLDCTPRSDVKPKGKEDHKGMQFHLQVWIDKHDQAFARVDAELLRNRDEMISGTAATLTWAPIDGAWLPTKVEINGKAKLGKGLVTFDTVYTYSNYKRFRTDVRVLSGPPPDNGPNDPRSGLVPPSSGAVPNSND